jgi:hypothetical protein
MNLRDQFKIWCLCFTLFSLVNFCDVKAQTSTSSKTVRGIFYYRTRLLIDSLSGELENSIRTKESLNVQITKLDEKLSSVELERDRLLDEKSKLSSDLEEALGDNLQSSHTNSILFIFNIIIGILLLVAIIWIFLRKKSDVSSIKINERNPEDSDSRFARIEKLGNLRDKGLLTEEEFVFQKRQILGDK